MRNRAVLGDFRSHAEGVAYLEWTVGVAAARGLQDGDEVRSELRTAELGLLEHAAFDDFEEELFAVVLLVALGLQFSREERIGCEGGRSGYRRRV